MRLLDRFAPDRSRDGDDERACRCRPRVETPAGAADGRVTLRVDADDCPGGGDLAAEPDCRAAVVTALADRDADAVRTRANGLERTYDGRAAALLLAAGRFVERAAFHDADLADRARRDPRSAAREATGRAGPVADVAAETGLAEYAAGLDAADAYRATVAPTVAHGRTVADPPPGATLRDAWDLDTGGTVRLYATDGPRDHYHLTPASAGLDADALATLAAARRRLADGTVEGGERAPGRAVRAVAAEGDPVERLAGILRKHTRGNGLLDDLFADPRLTDAYLTAPVASTPLRVTVDGEALTTNVRFFRADAETLASRLRAESGRAFSRASPTADATLDGVRVAGVTDPASDGPAFAFRRADDDPWTLARLVATGSLPARAAALCSLAVERGAAGLVAGPRGAGKTTTLGALLWELPPATRAVVVEETPELPTDALGDAGRDVQALRVGTDGDAALSPTDAVRAALRLGEGSLVVGEVRGEEARALYEAMRIGAAADAVLGTIHGTGGASVRERVVSDLGVPESSFAATDFVLTLGPDRRLDAVEEVLSAGDGADGETRFAPLFEREGSDGGPGGDARPGDAGAATPTGRVDRGESALLAGLVRPGESYADVLETLDGRTARFRDLAADGRTGTDAAGARADPDRPTPTDATDPTDSADTTDRTDPTDTTDGRR